MLVFALWASFAFIALSVILTVASVGKPRERLTGPVAALSVLFWAVILIVIANAAVQLS